jgi:Zn-dependent peptidase ImmA (M78 family)/transcriptional regulator with XRE-family HTH domain
MTIAGNKLDGFCGARLRIARTFKGCTQNRLAEEVAVRHQFIAALENNRKEPSKSLARALADALGFQTDFFSGPPLVEFTDAECSFRSWRTTPVTARAKARAFGTLLRQFLDYARERLTLPAKNLPRPESGASSATEAVERAAELCRMRWGLGLDLPIKNMTRVMESLAGVPVARFEGIAERIDAFSWSGDPPMIVINEKSPSRLRFDLAHECGHLVLHQGRITGTAETEAEANHFAGALLLPRSGFAREFPRGDSATNLELLFMLKGRWLTSVSAMIRRASELKLINGIQYRRLYKSLSLRGWLRHEPQEFDREAPETIPLVLEGLREHHGLGVADVAGALSWKVETLATIAGVRIDAPETTERANVFPIFEKRRAL